MLHVQMSTCCAIINADNLTTRLCSSGNLQTRRRSVKHVGSGFGGVTHALGMHGHSLFAQPTEIATYTFDFDGDYRPLHRITMPSSTREQVIAIRVGRKIRNFGLRIFQPCFVEKKA